MNNHILVVGVGSSIAHRYYLEEIKSKGYQITLITKEYKFWFKDLVNYIIFEDLFNINGCIELVLTHHKKNEIHGIFCYLEPFVPLWAALSESLALPGISREAAFLCRNKYAMRKAFEESGIFIPKIKIARTKYDIANLVENSMYPLVIKPVEGASSIAVMRINDSCELEKYITELATIPESLNFAGEWGKAFLIEEYMDGEEVSIDSVVFNGTIQPIFICEKINSLKGPYFLEEVFLTPHRFDKTLETELIQLNEEVIKSVKADNCVTHAEFRITSQGVRVLEVAARPGGLPMPAMCKASTNNDITTLMIQLALGKSPQIIEKFQIFSAIKWIFSGQEGTINCLKGLDSCMNSNGIYDMNIIAKVGDQVFLPPHPNSFRANIATLVSVGETAEECLNNLNDAAQKIEVTFE